MPYATVSSKGQITLPSRSRQALGLRPRDRVSVSVRGGAIVIKPVGDFFALKGFLGKGLSPAEERRRMALGIARHTEGKG